ncbi:hypothetical protein VNO77_25996 [Canavalia gladiata]|uniref:Uncharacterized protein n=1 Tax=Canavalia gladiata TaxID=3824 RepID=A0AAN9Q996_CANGL
MLSSYAVIDRDEIKLVIVYGTLLPQCVLVSTWLGYTTLTMPKFHAYPIESSLPHATGKQRLKKDQRSFPIGQKDFPALLHAQRYARESLFACGIPESLKSI